jgi:Na+-translocating ferredoxin:NAD+ oxidoreductase subunit C
MSILTNDSYKVWPLPGGIHPEENKDQSNQVPIQTAAIPYELILPLSQHIGAPSKLLVKVGDTVLKGQKLADADGFISACLHAPTSGEIIAIEDRPSTHSSGFDVPSVVLRTDGKDEWSERSPLPNWKDEAKNLLLDRIRQSGLVGLGGAGFPTSVKTDLNNSEKLKTLIVNGTECEPYITADDMLMRERSEKIISGIQILCHLLDIEQVFIGIEDNKPEAIAAMQKAVTESTSSNISVRSFETKYPSGGEKQLIYILTGEEVPSGGLPSDLGIICQNVGTIAAIHDAIVLDHPLISRITTVTGDAVNRAGNVDVLLGTPMIELLKAHEFMESRLNRLIMGGPMMGVTIADFNAPVIKTTNCLLASTRQELPDNDMAMACIRCGMCEQACPVELLPQQLYFYGMNKEWDKAEQQNLFDCIECGACSYVCPSQIPLVQHYRFAKGEIKREQKESIASQKAKERYENRLARLEGEAAEKIAKKAARAELAAKAKAAKEKNKGESTVKDMADAAVARVNKSNPNSIAITTVSKEDLEKKLKTAQEKVATAQTRLKDARENDESLVAALENALKKLTQKAVEAERQLSSSDQAPATEAPVEDVRVKIVRNKVEKTQERLADAKANDPDKVEALTKTLEKAQAQLANMLGADTPAAPQDSGNDLAALESTLEKAIDKRDKSKARLDDAKDNKPDRVEAFEKVLVTFERKVVDAQSALDQAKQGGSTTASVDNRAELQVALEKAIDKRDKSKARLDDARENKPERVEAFEKVLVTFERKVVDAQSALDQAQQGGSTAVDNSAELKAALEKAIDKRDKSQARLDDAKENKPDRVEAFEKVLVTFERKVKEAQTALENS